MEYGHLAHIELLFFYDVNSPQRQTIPLEIMQKSTETDIRHGYHASTPPASKAMMGKIGPLYSNFNVWLTKIKETFDPNTVAKPMS